MTRRRLGAALAMLALLSVSASACRGRRTTSAPVGQGTSGAARADLGTPPVSPTTATTTTRYAYEPSGPYLGAKTGLRVLAAAPQTLEEVDLDAGSRHTLISLPDTEFLSFSLERVRGGVLVTGLGENGSAAERRPDWYVESEASGALYARRLGVGTSLLDEPSGGIWRVDLPDNAAGAGSGTITLLDTYRHVLRRGWITGRQRPLASLGGGRFVTEVRTDESGRTYLAVYDALTSATLRRLTPIDADPNFQRVDDGAVVWTDFGCSPPCTEHVVDVTTGRQSDRPGEQGVRSPDGKHWARVVDDIGHATVIVDGQPLANSDAAAIAGRLDWSPDSRWLLFLRPDRRRLGIWPVGSAEALTVKGSYSGVDDWVVLDQRGRG